MRLTNVAHLRLPFGRLHGYDVQAGQPGRELPLSFDQRRHVAAGERPGSWMALSFALPSPTDREDLAAAWLAVVARHGALRSVVTSEPLALREVEVLPGAWREHPVGPGQSVEDALRRVLDGTCTPFSRPAHRLCALETAAGTTVVIGVDHAHVDMWSMLVIGRDLLSALADLRAGRPASLPPVPAFAEHTEALRVRPPAPEDVRDRWAEILAESGDAMPRFPLPLGEASLQPERVEVREVLDIDDAAAFSAEARARSASTLALTVSALTEVTRELAGTPLRAVFPVHSRYDPTWHDSVGWFITNSVLAVSDADPRAGAAAVKEAIRLGSCSLEEVLSPWGGMPESPGMFAISWLDLRRLPVRFDATGLDAQYVGAATRTDGVMLWFILDDTGLHLRCRYPDTLEARASVGSWLDALVRRLQDRARSSAGDELPLGERTFRVTRARREDVPAIRALLRDDRIGATREGAEESLAAYEAAFDQVARDSAHYLAVVRDEADDPVGTMQLTILPGLSRQGSARLQIEAVRVARHERSHGLGAAMIEWAHEHGRARGASLAQLTTDLSRDGARAFYTRLGYEESHAGLKRPL